MGDPMNALLLLVLEQKNETEEETKNASYVTSLTSWRRVNVHSTNAKKHYTFSGIMQKQIVVSSYILRMI